MRKGEISTWGPAYHCKSEGDFESKLQQFVYVSKEIQKLELEIKTSIDRALDGNDPELLIQIDDSKLNLEVY